MRRSLAIILAIVIVLAVVTLWGARPGPVLAFTGTGFERFCSYDTAQGNTSYWSVFSNLTNRGASASAAVVISVDGTGLVNQYYSVPSGATVEIHQIVRDSQIPVDPACLQHNVTVAVGGYLL